MSGGLESSPVVLSKVVQKLPENLWVRVSELINQHKPVNLSTGYPDFNEIVPKLLKEALIATQQDGLPPSYNQYPRSQGHPLLTQELSEIYSEVLGRMISHEEEVLITVGADEALASIIRATVNAGEEVIIIEPCYTAYAEAVVSCGGIAKFVPLKLKSGGKCASDFVYDEQQLKQAFSERTKAIVINTPQNPTGKIFSHDELMFIAELCERYNCLLISDEVYDRLYYTRATDAVDSLTIADPIDGPVVHAATLPGMWERCVTIGSAGKSLGVTGWKVGWMIGPKYLISSAQKIHASTVYCVAGPLQIALAAVLREEKKKVKTADSYWHWVRSILTTKRDRVYKMLSNIGLKPILPDGGYFMLIDLSGFDVSVFGGSDGRLRDEAFIDWLITKIGVAGIPVSSFYSESSKCDRFVRFCFIRDDETIDAAEKKMSSISHQMP